MAGEVLRTVEVVPEGAVAEGELLDGPQPVPHGLDGILLVADGLGPEQVLAAQVVEFLLEALLLASCVGRGVLCLSRSREMESDSGFLPRILLPLRLRRPRAMRTLRAS